MSLKTADVRAEYVKNKELREEDVKLLQEWVEKQPHLPSLTELQLILFLQSCYFSVETAKTTIDTFFTIKTHCAELFANRNPCSAIVKEALDMGLYVPLPKPTSQNYRVFICKLMDSNLNRYSFVEQLKIFDMSVMFWLMQEGTSDGVVIVNDMGNITFGHMTKISIIAMKKFLYYLQEALPMRLVGLHFINVVPFMDKVMAIMKPFMKKELMDVLHIHADSLDTLYKFVPQECLPKDSGGTAPTLSSLHESMKKTLVDHSDYFIADEKLLADESKRPGKPKNVGDIFGVEGTFKKLDID